MLAGNLLTELPNSLAQCVHLELIRIAANQFTALPEVVLQLPKLAWLAYAGNPFCDALESASRAQYPIRDIDWTTLTLGRKLGEGASGVIYQADWHDGEQIVPVAVKLFKAAVTSDGVPHSEMAACIAAGQHANLIAVHGRICHHPEAALGLVLDLIDDQHTILVGPPSLASCTRDIYPDHVRLSREQADNIYQGIASAINQLHAHGLIHGDVYGHNILKNEAGHAILGDFGAASFVDLRNTAQADALLEIELRALAHLKDELKQRVLLQQK
ncbi:protein kinase domain-containing protein [Chitinibacter bivalviorum]|uniref:protein kinase domain-containing protein n=1 Tax=Chitinibacter bivalviorum TaxID=2739434 RepID=UPI001C54B6FB|nr:protein kinase [Chitinibacter bivalviorum]